MASVARQSDFQAQIAPQLPQPHRPAGRLWRWLYDAVMLSRQRQTQREIDAVVSWRDGGFTDSLEREIAERSYSDGWNFRR